MMFRIKVRGGGGLVLADFRCAEHGVFEATAARDADVAPCPTCGASAPWSPSVVMGRVAEVSAVQGKHAPKPHRYAMDTRPLGEGQTYKEWRAERKKIREALRHKRVEALLR